MADRCRPPTVGEPWFGYGPVVHLHGPPAPRRLRQQPRKQTVRAVAPTGPMVHPRAVGERAALQPSEGVVEPDRTTVEQRRLPGDVGVGHAIDGTSRKRGVGRLEVAMWWRGPGFRSARSHQPRKNRDRWRSLRPVALPPWWCSAGSLRRVPRQRTPSSCPRGTGTACATSQRSAARPTTAAAAAPIQGNHPERMRDGAVIPRRSAGREPATPHPAAAGRCSRNVAGRSTARPPQRPSLAERSSRRTRWRRS